MTHTTDSDAMNQVGEPDAGNPHVRFDERGLETGGNLPRQSSTLLNSEDVPGHPEHASHRWRSLGLGAVLFDRFFSTEQNVSMIRSFTCFDTESLFHSQVVPRFKNIERVARRKLLQLNAATELFSLRVPPGNALEALKGGRRGQHSIRINDQWRICFVWHDDGAHQVEIVDYHSGVKHG